MAFLTDSSESVLRAGCKTSGYLSLTWPNPIMTIPHSNPTPIYLAQFKTRCSHVKTSLIVRRLIYLSPIFLPYVSHPCPLPKGGTANQHLSNPLPLSKKILF
jgi:hypothetical protein